jgi:hypothetical protein
MGELTQITETEGGSFVAWHEAVSTFVVVGPLGVQATHTGVGLTLTQVVRHLVESAETGRFHWGDLIVFEGGRARVIVKIMGDPGPRRRVEVSWIWDQVNDRPMGSRYTWRGEPDEDDDAIIEDDPLA